MGIFSILVILIFMLLSIMLYLISLIVKYILNYRYNKMVKRIRKDTRVGLLPRRTISSDMYVTQVIF